jgi:hypothetical protein
MAAHYAGHQRLPPAANARVALAARRGPARRSSRGAPAVNALASAPRPRGDRYVVGPAGAWSCSRRSRRASWWRRSCRVGRAASGAWDGCARACSLSAERAARSISSRHEPTSPRYANCSEPTEAPAKRVPTPGRVGAARAPVRRAPCSNPWEAPHDHPQHWHRCHRRRRRHRRHRPARLTPHTRRSRKAHSSRSWPEPQSRCGRAGSSLALNTRPEDPAHANGAIVDCRAQVSWQLRRRRSGGDRPPRSPEGTVTASCARRPVLRSEPVAQS